jgi:RNA-directed DNA polymerase
VGLRLARRSLGRVKRQLRQMTRRSSGQALETVIDRLNPYIRGWVGYFRIAEAKSHLQHLDKHLRRRLRQFVWKQWKTPANRYRNLRTRGVSEFWAIRAGGTSKGTWRLAASPPLQRALNNAYWDQMGLESFFKRYQAFRST